jgi:4-carboxymuconolactone decarboxylase
MRVKLVSAVVVTLAGMAAGLAVAPARTEAQATRPELQAAGTAPTIEDLRRAVSSLRGDRIKRPTSYEELTAEQQAFVKSVLSGPRRGIDGSLGVMLASPAFADLMQKTIAYARFAGRDGYSSVPPKLAEMAIIMGARAWTAQYAWYVHRRAAVMAGLNESLVGAIRDGKRPASMQKDEEAVYNFCNELLTARQVSDATFQAARTVLGGDRGIVDLIGTLGAYQTVAMMMVVDRFPLPEGAVAELKPLK